MIAMINPITEEIRAIRHELARISHTAPGF
jgi:hypothetical protein